MIEGIKGFWIRREALRLTAMAFKHDADTAVMPQLWSVAVFFECYLRGGAEGTREDFGPKEPAELKVVSQ